MDKLTNDAVFEIIACIVEIGWSSTKPHPALLASHVCQQWNLVAIAHPTLWTQIGFARIPPIPTKRDLEYFQSIGKRNGLRKRNGRYPGRYPYSDGAPLDEQWDLWHRRMGQFINHFELLAGRAKHHPMDVKLSIAEGYYARPRAGVPAAGTYHLRAVVYRLRLTCGSWRSLDLLVPITKVNREWLILTSQPPNMYPALTTLSLDLKFHTATYMQSYDIGKNFTITGAPLLTSVSFDGISGCVFPYVAVFLRAVSTAFPLRGRKYPSNRR